jgi:lipopolysaccharide transport system permease protein
MNGAASKSTEWFCTATRERRHHMRSKKLVDDRGVLSGSRKSMLAGYLQSGKDVVQTWMRHRRLLTALARRNLSDEYVGHGLSVLWNVIQPLFTMAVYLFCFVFIFPSRVTSPTGFSANAVVYLLAGITPWMVLVQVMGRASGSIVNNSNIVKQMAFPLELLPITALSSPLCFGAVALAVLLTHSIWVTGGAGIWVYIWGAPLLVSLSLLLFAGLSLLLSSLQIFFRDTKEFVSMFATIGIFTHPILYLPGAVPEVVRPILYASPFTYFIMCWQDVFFYGTIERAWAWIITVVFATGMFLVGSRIFEESKPHFGDFL